MLLLEQGKLTSGTTWHAAGLVGQMRPNRNMTRMSKYGIELYATLEAETGLATGWKQCGSVNVARSARAHEGAATSRRRWRAASASSVEIIAAEAHGELYPLLRTDDLQGALWMPGDGKANPADLCMSLAKGARNRGVKIVEDVEVTGVLVEHGRVTGVRTAQGDVALRSRRQLRRPVGAPVRPAGRRQRAAVFGRALLHRHRPHRRRARRCCR